MKKLFKAKTWPRISINTKGRLHLSKAALEKYGQPKYAELEIKDKTLIMRFAKVCKANKTTRKVSYPDSHGQAWITFTELSKTIFKVKKTVQLEIKLLKNKIICSL